jgi:threonine dehydrogenase-like Zn-dependent dehydrogenase
VLVTGAGPIGLLAALLGVQHGFEVHVLDRVTRGPKPELVRRLGARYHTGPIAELGLRPRIVLECTGVAQVIVEAVVAAAPGAVVCLTGVGAPLAAPKTWEFSLATHVVLNNLGVFGSVNANRRHYELAAHALAKADHGWLEGLISRRVEPGQFERALGRSAEDIKAVVVWSQA